MRQISLIMLLLLNLIMNEIQAYDPGVPGLDIKYMDPEITITISTGIGLNGVVWMGPDYDWEIATDPDLYYITLNGESSYMLEHVSYRYPSNQDGNIAYGLFKLQVGTYEIYLDWRDDDYRSGSPSGYIDETLHIRWNGTKFEQELLNHDWPTIQDGDTVAIWQNGRKESGVPSHMRFQPTVPENLALSTASGGPGYVKLT